MTYGKATLLPYNTQTNYSEQPFKNYLKKEIKKGILLVDST